MIKELPLKDFLERNHIDEKIWEAAQIEWHILEEISADHIAQSDQMAKSATLFANTIQKFEKVHSVRWRIKDADHLLEKIVRKRAEGNSKYADISLANYFERVTDLVGIRALHLFKEDCLEIDVSLKKQWIPIETPTVYKRVGDNEELSKDFQDKGFEIKDHPKGYRSVHYVIQSSPFTRKIITEIQVRTIFEEGWSEIDHKIRYPNFSDNELVSYFLGIFNRMAGSADEMGGFVRGLAKNITNLEDQLIDAKEAKESTLYRMEQALIELESIKIQGNASKEIIAKLKAEVASLKEIKKNNLSLSLFGHTSISEARNKMYANRLSELALGTTTNLGLSSLGYTSIAETSSKIYSNKLSELALGYLDSEFMKKKTEPPAQ